MVTIVSRKLVQLEQQGNLIQHIGIYGYVSSWLTGSKQTGML